MFQLAVSVAKEVCRLQTYRESCIAQKKSQIKVTTKIRSTNKITKKLTEKLSTYPIFNVCDVTSMNEKLVRVLNPIFSAQLRQASPTKEKENNRLDHGSNTPAHLSTKQNQKHTIRATRAGKASVVHGGGGEE